MGFALLHETIQKLRHISSLEAYRIDPNHQPIARLDIHTPVRTLTEADKFRFALTYSGSTNDKGGHLPIGRFLHNQCMIPHLPLPEIALVGKEEGSLFPLPIIIGDDRCSRIADTHLQAGGGSKLGRELRNGIGGQG